MSKGRRSVRHGPQRRDAPVRSQALDPSLGIERTRHDEAVFLKRANVLYYPQGAAKRFDRKARADQRTSLKQPRREQHEQRRR